MSFSALRNRAVGAVSNYLDRGYDTAALFDYGNETPITRRHMHQFLSALFFVSLCSTLGSYFCSTSAFGRIFSALVACLMFRGVRRSVPSEQRARVCLLAYCAFFVWSSITLWLTWFLGVDKGFVVCIMLDATLYFNTQRFMLGNPFSFTYDYWEALVLYCLVPGVFVNRLAASVFGADSDLWRDDQHFWLNLLFVVYVALYSMEVALRARRGDDDHVKHALHFYTDFPSFVIHTLKGLWKLRRRSTAFL